MRRSVQAVGSAGISRDKHQLVVLRRRPRSTSNNCRSWPACRLRIRGRNRYPDRIAGIRNCRDRRRKRRCPAQVRIPVARRCIFCIGKDGTRRRDIKGLRRCAGRFYPSTPFRWCSSPPDVLFRPRPCRCPAEPLR